MPSSRTIYVDPATPDHFRHNWAVIKFLLANELVTPDDLTDAINAEKIHTFTAGEALTARQVVYQSAPGTVSLAQADSELDVAGFVVADASMGADVEVQYGGFMSGFSGLTPDGVLFLSHATAGLATHTAPTAEGVGQAVIWLGRAVSATKVWIDCQPGILL